MYGGPRPLLVGCRILGVVLAGAWWWWAPRRGRSALGVLRVVRAVLHLPRGVLRVVGAVLLLLVVMLGVSRSGVFWVAAGSPGFFEEDRTRRIVDLALVAVGLAAGLFVGWRLLDDGDEAPAEPPAPLATLPEGEPALRAWPEPEVLGDAPEGERRDFAPPPVAPARRVRSGGHVRRLGLVALGIALPVSFGPGITRASQVGFGLEKIVVSTVLAYLLGGLTTGAALYGVLARDDDDPPLLMVLFGVVAVGVGVLAVYPRTFANESWVSFGTGLAAGILLPAALHGLGSALSEERRRIGWGSGLAVGLLIVTWVVVGRASGAREDPSDDLLRSRVINPSGARVPDLVYQDVPPQP